VARRTSLAIALIVLALAAASHLATAQSLARLTVQSFTLTSDTSSPHVDVPFHLIVSLRARERMTQIANLELPMLAELELLGDERQTLSGAQGTQYRETITVIAHNAGTISVSPATLQAIDARDGKPKQWYTNGLTLHVPGNPVPVFRNGVRAVTSVALAMLRLLLWLIGIGCIAAIVALLVMRRRRQPIVVAVPPASPPPTLPPRSLRDQLTDALTVLRTERTRGAAVRVRAAVWRTIGAREGETLADVLRRPQACDPAIRHLLIALERSAFTYDDDLSAAIEDGCAALQRCIEFAA
jgi:hypothetical protein